MPARIVRQLKPPADTSRLAFAPLRSKTVWGATLMAVAQVLADQSIPSILGVLGMLLTVIGARDAIAKGGT